MKNAKTFIEKQKKKANFYSSDGTKKQGKAEKKSKMCICCQKKLLDGKKSGLKKADNFCFHAHGHACGTKFRVALF